MPQIKPNAHAPDFLVVGTAKAGTTSLHHMLATHPGICLSRPKETWFFDGPAYAKGLDHYLATHFGAARPGQLRGEVATSYLYAPFVAERLAQSTPDTLLIAILRDPVERAFSDWWMMHSRGWDPLSFEDAIADNLKRLETGPDFSDPADWAIHLDSIRSEGCVRHRTYIDYGFYEDQLSRYTAHGFDGNRLLVLQFEQLLLLGPSYIDQIYASLGLETPQPDGPETAFMNRQNEALPSRRIGRTVQLMHHYGLSRIVPPPISSVAKRWLGQMKRTHFLAQDSRSALEAIYRERFGSHGVLTGIDLSLWRSLSPSSQE